MLVTHLLWLLNLHEQLGWFLLHYVYQPRGAGYPAKEALAKGADGGAVGGTRQGHFTQDTVNPSCRQVRFLSSRWGPLWDSHFKGTFLQWTFHVRRLGDLLSTSNAGTWGTAGSQAMGKVATQRVPLCQRCLGLGRRVREPSSCCLIYWVSMEHWVWRRFP